VLRALVSVILAEVTKRMDVHDYSSLRTAAPWPERLILHPDACLLSRGAVELG